MRRKSDPQRFFDFTAPSDSKIVQEYEAKYNRISAILDENPAIVDAVHRDVRKLSEGDRRGREATYTSENFLRALIVHQLEGTSYRRTIVRLSHSGFLQRFVRLGHRKVMSHVLLNHAFKAITPATWSTINEALTAYAVEEGAIQPQTLRVDTTVVESNIHYPTDSSLLWDSFRTLYRILEKARKHTPGIITERFHRRKAKKRHLFITRYSPSKSKKRQRKVRSEKRKFLAQVEHILRAAQTFVVKGFSSALLLAAADDIRLYLPRVEKVLAVAKRVWLAEETVPAAERIFSIFEEHTELIKRGRRHKPVEFGHMILLGQSKERFVTQYDVMEKKIPDSYLPESILQRHEATFGERPETLVADKGFCGTAEAMAELREKVATVAIPQRLKDYTDAEFVALQHFRAGIEGSISVLKRAFGLMRCRYRGFKSFVANVALGVFSHNLVILAGVPPP